MSSTGCFGGTSPSGRLGRNVAQGSSSSSAQSMFLLEVAVLTGRLLGLARHGLPILSRA